MTVFQGLRERDIEIDVEAVMKDEDLYNITWSRSQAGHDNRISQISSNLHFDN